MEHTENKGNGGFLIWAIILVCTGLWLGAGYLLAKAGASYRVVKVFLYPAYIFLGNLFGVMPFVCAGWVLALVTGNRDMANYVVGNASELALLSTLFGDPITVPIWHIIVYQFFIWALITRGIAETFTTAIYNLARPNSAQ